MRSIVARKHSTWSQKYGKIGRKPNPYFKDGALTNGRQLIANLRQRSKQFANKCDQLALLIATKLAERAKSHLYNDAGNLNREQPYYDVERLLKNIYVHRYSNNNYRVAIRNNSEEPIMYLLEFGTGIVGQNDPHEMAQEFGWEYAVNEDSYIDPRTSLSRQGIMALEEPDLKGWIFFDDKENRKVFTSGLFPVSYMYSALQEIDEVVAEARKEIGL